MTKDTTEGVLTHATGIPPHIQHSCDMQTIMDMVEELLVLQHQFKVGIKESMETVLNDGAEEAGVPSIDSIRNFMSEKSSQHQQAQKILYDAALKKMVALHKIKTGTAVKKFSRQ